MRLRITRQLDGSMDGIQLAQFVPGQVYDVGTSMGSYLLSMEAAEPVSEVVPAGLTFEQQLFRAGHGAVPVDTSHDKDSRKKRR
jgi:hypothetical protein